ncbi:MAG: 2,3-bisphosphoglycerate-independent phosphoglycerate mutase [Candidatus Yanofskybacteria bacterium]|nr:2,3-bisphosphoglycerate-independent phosphoglycerate mutase [Candidatus Yanofskybacteria bacterium]
MAENKKPLVLAILDGWGFNKKEVGNPIAMANKPTLDRLVSQFPMLLLQASGLAVGMTWGESGNSEVGHLNIGAGRVIEQYLSRINRAVKDGSFFVNDALTGAFDHARKNSGQVHLVGLLTSGTVHADFSHIVALLEFARQKTTLDVYLHLFLDGKDSGLQEAPALLEKLSLEITSKGCGKIATLIGRNFAMDRDNNWGSTERSYRLLTAGEGEMSDDYIKTVKNYYASGKNDSTMEAIVNAKSGFKIINENDAVIFFNFREDSMRQILKPFVEEGFSLFQKKDLKNVFICTMTKYSENPIAHVAFAPPIVINSLAEVLENNGMNQFHIAESEKYAHVTYFFNGLREQGFSKEVDVFIESDKNSPQEPAMKSKEIAEKVIGEINKNIYDFIILNFANADILAHTGDFKTVTKGIEAVDSALGLVVNKILELDGVMIVTSDHGNAESLVYRSSGEAETRHNDSPVPFYLVGQQYQTNKTTERIAQETSEIAGILGDIAPTILELMGISQPEEITGKSLLPLLVANTT